MPNRLQDEQSLYLRQHANQAVDWYPWGEAALAEAKACNKPLLISIGYSACHWCHVMAHECFDDAYIAALMNKHFVCVKVDREEYPDVDQVYMEAVQMLQHHGGWPLHVFCLPDGRPFFGGTYFPPDDRGNGLVPWPQLLMRIAEHYRSAKDELVENADAIQKNILAANQVAGAAWQAKDLVDAVRGICGTHDDTYGGFGQAPKFPPAMVLNFLRAMRNDAQLKKEDPQLAERVDRVCHQTLKAMAHGGLYDQFGGGFARYSVDTHWLIPHFEKMLYDNALLIDAYTRGWLDSKDPLYAAVVDETMGWLERDMSAAGGGYYSAVDADSEEGEGHYYVWNPEEIDLAVGPSVGREIRAAYNITAAGNFEADSSNPSLVEASWAVRAKLAPAREALRKYREANRQPPGKDSKLLTAWNSLLVRSMAEAGFYLNRPDWLQRARSTADFIWQELVEPNECGTARLKAVYYSDVGASVDGYLHDYALAAEAFLAVAAKIDCLDVGASRCYLKRAKVCVDSALELFEDATARGYFFTADGVNTPVARRKEWFDNATPSGNSALLHALSGLYALTSEARYDKAFNDLCPAYSDSAKHVASGVAHALEAIAVHQQGVQVIKIRQGAPLEALHAALTMQPWQRRFLQVIDSSQQQKNYQLCVGTQCHPGVSNPADLFA